MNPATGTQNKKGLKYQRMTDRSDLQSWMASAGYEYHSFVSWPHVPNSEVRDCAERLRDRILESLAPYVAQPRVFLDTTSIPPGDDWRRRIEAVMCRSLTMVAICAPMYYHPDHRWCGQEWAAMEELGRCRLGDLGSASVVPLIFRRRGSLPQAVERHQYIDISGQEVRGPAYYRTQEFRRVIVSVVETVLDVAELLREHNSRPGCEDFTLPDQSAFDDYVPPPQPSPFRRMPDLHRRLAP